MHPVTMHSRADGPILVYRIGQLGDTVVSLPVIARLRQQNPGRRMILLTDRHPGREELVSSWGIVGALGLCDEVMRYDVHDHPLRNLIAYLDLAKRVRAIAPSEVVNLAPRMRARVAWRDKIFFQRICGVSRYRAVPPATPQLRPGGTVEPEWRRLLRAIDPTADGALAFTPDMPAWALDEAMAAISPLPAAARLIAFGPGSKMPSKRWPIERYQEVGKRILREDAGTAIVILGGTEDKAQADRLQQSWGARSLNLCGRLSILGSAAVLARCATYLGNDTGTMHLAGLVGTRCVAIFSARDHSGKWVPMGEGHCVLRKSVPCEGCMLEICDKDNLCLTKIDVEEVMSAWTTMASRH